MERARDRRGRRVRQGGRHTGGGSGSLRLVGHDPGPDRAARRRGPGARKRWPREGAQVHGARAGHGDPGHRGRHRLPRVVYQRPYRGPARRRRRPGRPQGERGDQGDGRARFDARQTAGRGRGAGRYLHGCRLRLAQRGVFDVPRHEPRRLAAGRAVRIDQQPQLRGTPGQGWQDAPRQPGSGRRDGRHGPVRLAERARRTDGGGLMEPVDRVSGTALPLGYSDVDTDQIVPSDALKRIERTGFGQFLFSGWREDDEFIMNREEHEDAVILLAGENFGSGSSREHAVWAIKDHGFDAVIAPSFADIFKNNSTKNGLLAIDLPEETVRNLLEAVRDDPETVITIELDELTVTAPNVRETFEMDDFTRQRIMQGLDDISLTLAHEDDLETFERSRPAHLPTVH